MNILQVSILLAILLKCVTASESGVAQDVIDALGEPGFESIKRDFWMRWTDRKDLFDYVVAQKPDFIVGFIKEVGPAKEHTLAALFDKEPGKVSEVLRNIDYGDRDLIDSVRLRPEVASQPEEFLRILDMLKTERNQDNAVIECVNGLIPGKENLVAPLIEALGSRTFKHKNLKGIAIRRAFFQGIYKGVKDIVEELHEDLVITHGSYAAGLVWAWSFHQSTIFTFLLSHADQGDLANVKAEEAYAESLQFRNAIDKESKIAPPAGTRHRRSLEKTKLAINTLTKYVETGAWVQQPGSIIASYLHGEPEGGDVVEKIRQENIASSQTGQGVGTKEQQKKGKEVEKEEVEETEEQEIEEEVE